MRKQERKGEGAAIKVVYIFSCLSLPLFDRVKREKENENLYVVDDLLPFPCS